MTPRLDTANAVSTYEACTVCGVRSDVKDRPRADSLSATASLSAIAVGSSAVVFSAVPTSGVASAAIVPAAVCSAATTASGIARCTPIARASIIAPAGGALGAVSKAILCRRSRLCGKQNPYGHREQADVAQRNAQHNSPPNGHN